jgi:hypothetical protein
MTDLTCEQVRLLVGQKMGLELLADAVARFVTAKPAAYVTFYPGDMTVAALRAFPQLLEHAPASAREMLKIDFGFLAEQERLWAELEEAIEASRSLGEHQAKASARHIPPLRP